MRPGSSPARTASRALPSPPGNRPAARRSCGSPSRPPAVVRATGPACSATSSGTWRPPGSAWWRPRPWTPRPATSRTRPPGPSGSATASSRSTRSTRCRAGSRAIPPPSTSRPCVRPGESPAERAGTPSGIMVWGRGVRGRWGDVTQESLSLPAIPVSAGALIFDPAGRLLILKPTYKSGWTIPGGVMEADGETPWDACRREVAEECGLDIGAAHAARLACMDFRRPRPSKPGGIRYLFDCGTFSDATLAGIVVQPEEIAEHRVADLRTALTMLRKPIRLRVRAATHGRGLCYLEDGRPVPGVGTGGH